MARISQGENFEEAPIVDATGQIVDQNSAEQQNAPTPPKFGPKQIAIGAAIAVVVVVGAVILLSSGGKDKVPADGTNTSSVAEDDPFDDDGFIDGGFGTDNNQSTGFIDDEGFIDDTPANSSGSASDNRTAVSDPYTYISYSGSEVQSLRANGYTGDEIEYAAQQGRSYDELISEANAAREAANREWMDTVLNSASDGYKDLMNRTFLGLPTTAETTEGREVYHVETKKENVDYEKIGVYNYQAWVKLHLSFGDIFYLMPLDRYDDLANTGNIVISYSVRSDVDYNIIDISNVSEVII